MKNFISGAAIGVAMIIPGVSGGTIAVLLNVYDKLIEALGNLTSDFKKKFMFLLPVFLGALAAFAAMYFPLKLALEHAPFPTVMLFAGLMLGSFPKLFKDSVKSGFEKRNALSAAIPFIVLIGICVLKFCVSAPAADLSENMPIGGYFALFGVAMLASCALVVPGISGSMLLFIAGYYYPVLNAVSYLKAAFGHYFLVLFIFAAGLIVGFFSIAKLMRFFLNRFPRGTRWAIVGFVAASVPAIFITFDYPPVLGGFQVALGIIFIALGAVASYAFTAYAESKIR